MTALSEAERQALIAALLATDSSGRADAEALAAARGYFDTYLVPWDAAWPSLIDRGLLEEAGGAYALTDAGAAAARRARQETPDMWYFYKHFYEATCDSRAYAEFCRRAYGADFAQHGFSDLAQLDCMLDILRLGPDDCVLDIGCGNGGIAQYCAERTGAHVTGIDYAPEAICQASERTARDPEHLAFYVMSIDQLTFPPASFDAIISVDSIYFTDIEATLADLVALLRPGGRLAIFYGLGSAPGEDLAPAALQPECTPLGLALARLGLSWETVDFTRADYEHAQLMLQTLDELQPAFEAEGTTFLADQRRAEGSGISRAYGRGAMARYLYIVR